MIAEQKTKVETKQKVYDTIIIGGGPAGLTAAIYAVRAGLTALVMEGPVAGGQIGSAHLVENYPGFVEGISGMELVEHFKSQAIRLGAEIIPITAKSVDFSGKIKQVKTRKETFEAKTVVIATGATARKLGMPGESDYIGAGVSYCATCDGGFFKDMNVAVIGGGDTALNDAVYLSRIAKKVYIIHRRDAFRGAAASQKAALSNENVFPIYNSVVEGFEGGKLGLEKLLLRNVKTDQTSELPVDGAFVAVGNDPQTNIFEGHIGMEKGYILTDQNCLTSASGIYAIGDVRAGSIRQVVSAASDGAAAMHEIEKYISLQNDN